MRMQDTLTKVITYDILLRLWKGHNDEIKQINFAFLVVKSFSAYEE